MGGLGGVNLVAQIIGTLGGILVAIIGGVIVYGAIQMVVGLRLTEEEEYNGADLTIHRIGSTNDD